MPGDIAVRRMQQGDADAVRSLDGQILEGDRSTTWDLLVARYLEVSDLETLILPPWGCHVAEREGEIIGFILAERQVPVYGLPVGARIVAIGVHPDCRRMGVGRQLVDALVEDCRALGIPEVYSVLRTEDVRDTAFLASCGFSESRVRLLSKDV